MSVAIRFNGKFVFESDEILRRAIESLDNELLHQKDFVRKGRTASIAWDGWGPYFAYDDAMPQLEIIAESAIGGSICCSLDGEEIWVYATKPLGFSPVFERLLRDVIGEDWDGVESGRTDYRVEFGSDAVSAYKMLTNWFQKSAMIQLIQDHLDPTVHSIMIDFLNAPPEKSHDLIWMSKATAFSHLAGNHDIFMDLLKIGNEAVEAKAATYLKENT